MWKAISGSYPVDIDDNLIMDWEIPGWVHADFSRTGKLNIWSVLKVIEGSGSLKYQLPSHIYANYHQLRVVVAQITSVSEDLYKLASMTCPMICHEDFGFVGNTSASRRIEIKHKPSGKWLVRCEKVLVHIDPVKRTPKSAPQSMVKLQQLYPSKGCFVRVPEPPSNYSACYLDTVSIRPSDMDCYYHVNHASYYTFCLDTACKATQENFLHHFSYDIADYNIKETRVQHLSDSKAGETLNIMMWEDQEKIQLLHFRMTCDKNLVFCASIQFYPLHDDKAKL